MSDIIQCPHCERKLKVPENLRQPGVKCPTCGQLHGYRHARTAASVARTTTAGTGTGAILGDCEPRQRRAAPMNPCGNSQRRARTMKASASARTWQLIGAPLILILAFLGLVAFGRARDRGLGPGNSDLKEMRADAWTPRGRDHECQAVSAA